MKIFFAKVNHLLIKHPMAKGMIAYAIIWPLGSIAQQTLAGKQLSTYDWGKCFRFSIYGALFVAPTLYCWVKLSTAMWPVTNFRTGITKALVEQISYGPFAMVGFFFGMSLLEMKTLKEASEEVSQKFLPTFKIGLCVWPILQTINFSLIPERNRVPFVSVCSLLWTTFLAYMKQLETNKLLEEAHEKTQQ